MRNKKSLYATLTVAGSLALCLLAIGSVKELTNKVAGEEATYSIDISGHCFSEGKTATSIFNTYYGNAVTFDCGNMIARDPTETGVMNVMNSDSFIHGRITGLKTMVVTTVAAAEFEMGYSYDDSVFSSDYFTTVAPKTGTGYTFTYSFENNADKPSYFKLKGAQNNIELKSIVCTYTCAESTGYYSITDAASLKTALTTGKRAKLENDLSFTDTIGDTSDTNYVGADYYRFSYVPAGVKTYIDLNGHTISYKYGSGHTYVNMGKGVYGILVSSNASLTIDDTSTGHTGKIVFNGDDSTNWTGGLYCSPTISVNGSLTVLNGTVENTTQTNKASGPAGALQYAVDVLTGSTCASLSINGENALVKSDYYGAIRLFANSNVYPAVFNMISGNVWSGRTGIWIQNPTTYSATAGASYCTRADINIYGGTIHGERIGFYSETYPDADYSSEDVNAYKYNFTGGTIENNLAWVADSQLAPMVFGTDYTYNGVEETSTNYIRTMINTYLTLNTVSGSSNKVVYSPNHNDATSAIDTYAKGKTA